WRTDTQHPVTNISLIDLDAGTVVRDLASDVYGDYRDWVLSPDGHSLSYEQYLAGGNVDVPTKLIKAFDSAPSTITLSAAGEMAQKSMFSANGSNVFYTANPTGNWQTSSLEVAAASNAVPAPKVLSAPGCQVSNVITPPDPPRTVWFEPAPAH